jgi:hypothetical protein
LVAPWGCSSRADLGTPASSHPTEHEAALVPLRTIYQRGSAALVRLETPRSLGTAVLVRSDGLLLTVYPLLEGQRRARVVFSDGHSLEVQRVLWVSSGRELAVVSIDAQNLPAVPLAEARGLAVGDRVSVVGQALGMVSPIVVDGIVGGTVEPDRSPPIVFVPFDAPAGFRGAPVFDTTGDLVGVVLDHANSGTMIATANAASSAVNTMSLDGGETLSDFGRRTHRSRRWELEVPSFDRRLLVDCPGVAQARVFSELLHGIALSEPSVRAGEAEATYRILEDATLRVVVDTPQCKELTDWLLALTAFCRELERPTDAAVALATGLDSVLQALFSPSGASRSTRPRWNAPADFSLRRSLASSGPPRWR